MDWESASLDWESMVFRLEAGRTGLELLTRPNDLPIFFECCTEQLVLKQVKGSLSESEFGKRRSGGHKMNFDSLGVYDKSWEIIKTGAGTRDTSSLGAGNFPFYLSDTRQGRSGK